MVGKKILSLAQLLKDKDRYFTGRWIKVVKSSIIPHCSVTIKGRRSDGK